MEKVSKNKIGRRARTTVDGQPGIRTYEGVITNVIPGVKRPLYPTPQVVEITTDDGEKVEVYNRGFTKVTLI